MRKSRGLGKKILAIISATSILMSMVTITSSAQGYSTSAEGDIQIFVASTGNDKTGDGTIASPYATFEKARDVARELDKTDKTVTVYAREGKYFFDETLKLTAQDSGITFQSYNEEEVELSGAKTLDNLTWADYDKNTSIKVTQLETGLGIDQIFIDKNEQVMARYPNRQVGVVPLEGAASQAQIKARVANYADPTGGHIRAIHSNGWGGNDYIITGKNPGNSLGLTYSWVGDNNRGSGMNNSVMIENVFEELDAPNEWFYDNATGKLYFYPGEDVDLAASTVEAAVTTDIINIVGESSDAPVKDITLDGFNYFGTKRTMFTVNEEGKQYMPLMRGDWCVVKAGAVYMTNAENVKVINSNFNDMGGNGLFMYGYNNNHLIDNNEFIDIGATAVQVVGNPKAAREASFWGHDLFPNLQVHKTSVDEPDKIGPQTEDYPRDIIISKNHMENMGIFEKQSCGVNMSVSSRIKVLQNTIHKSARSDINVNDGTFGGHEIAQNDVFNAQLETSDHGQFNSWGRDRFWSVPRYNASGQSGDLIRHYPKDGKEYDLAKIDAYQTIKIHDNRFHHDSTVHTWGIDLDDGSSNYEIYNNLCLGMGIKLREGFDRKVYNNIIIDGPFSIHVSYKEARDEVYSNVVANSNPWALISADMKAAEYVVDKNWYYDFGNKINMLDGGFETNALVDVDPGFEGARSNNYTVTNTEGMEKTGFENFSMTQFGKPGCACKSPIYAKTGPGQGGGDILQRETWKGATITGIDDNILSSTASVGYNGVYFEDVPENSAAYTMGFRTRDIIKEVNGVTLGDKVSFHALYNKLPVGSLAIMNVHRTNKMQKISYMITETSSSLVDCNAPSVRYSTELSDDLYTKNGWYYDVRDMGQQGPSLAALLDTKGSNDAWFEVDFSGTQIEYITSVNGDQGKIKMTLVNKDTGAVVETKEIDCYAANKKMQQAVYTSPTLPQGNYTLRGEKVSGTYIIVDAFKVYGAPENITSLTTAPSSVTFDNGNDATVLREGERINYSTPFHNTGTVDMNVQLNTVLVDTTSGESTVVKSESFVVEAGKTATSAGTIDPIANVANKILKLVYTSNGTPCSYAIEIKGETAYMPTTSINQGTLDGTMSVTYNKDTRIVEVTAAGLLSSTQAICTATAGDKPLFFDQIKAQGTKAGFAFKLPESVSAQEVTFAVKGELKDEISYSVTIDPDQHLTNADELNATIAKATEIKRGDYTRDSWYDLKIALASAKEIVVSTDATQADINAANTVLNTAIVGLVHATVSITTPGNSDSIKRFGNQWDVRSNGHSDTHTQGHHAEFAFTGTSIKWYGEIAEEHGIAEVKILDQDGNVVSGSLQNIDCYGSRKSVLLYTFEGLTQGASYTLVLTQKDKNPSSGGYYMEIHDLVVGQYNETSIDKTALQTAYDTAVANHKQADYTEASWAVFATALANVDALIKDADAVERQIAPAIKALDDAIAGLEIAKEPVDSNKKILSFVIDYAQKAIDDGRVDALVPTAKANFMAAFHNATKKYNDIYATQDEVDQAWALLMDAIHTLSFVAGDKSDLNALIAVCDAYDINDIEGDTTAFTTALAAAKVVSADPDAMDSDIQKAHDALNAAMKALVFKDRTQLEAVVAYADTRMAIIDLYQDGEAKTAFIAAVGSAKAVLADRTATQAQIDAASTALIEATAKLRFIADKATLEQVLNDAKSIDVSVYTAASVSALEDAIKEGQKVFDDPNATKEEIDAAANRISDAKLGLVATTMTPDPAPTNPENPTTPVDKTDVTADGANGTTNSATTGDSNTLPIALVAGAAAVMLAGVAFKKRKDQ